MASQNSRSLASRNVPTTRTRIKVLTALNVELAKDNSEDEEEKHQKWQKRIVEELIASERSYIRHLTLLVDFFMNPIQSQNLMSSKEFNIVFGQINNIVHVNGELLKQLTEPNQQSVGKVFLDMAPFFKLYSIYANNFEGAVNLMQRLEKENSNFLTFKRNQESRPEVNMTLNSLLIMPVQRVPRYKLLLIELSQHTPPGSDYSLIQDAIQLVDKANSHINECIREHENMQKMLAIQQNMLGGQPKIVVPGRQFIKEGWLMKVSRKGANSHRRFFYLFNDMIVYCKQHSANFGRSPLLRCCCVLPIKHCTVESLFSSGHQQGVLMKLSCMDESLLLYTDDAGEGESWVTAIQLAIQQYAAFRRTLRKESSAKRPTRRAALKRNRDESLSSLSKKRKLEAKLLAVPHFKSTCTTLPFREPRVVLHDCISSCKKARLEVFTPVCVPFAKMKQDNLNPLMVISDNEKEELNSSSDLPAEIPVDEILAAADLPVHCTVTDGKSGDSICCNDEMSAPFSLLPQNVVSPTERSSKIPFSVRFCSIM